MKDKTEELFYEFLNVCSVFIGYELNDELIKVLVSIMDFIGDLLCLDSKDKVEAKELMLDLFSINNYSDYLLTKTKYCRLNSKLIRVGGPYFNELSKLDNRVSHFNKYYIKKQLDELTLNGSIKGTNLKAYLKYLGIIYDKNIDESIELFKLSAYSNDFFSFYVLSKITEEKEYYSDIYERIIRQLSYYEYKKDDGLIEIILACHKKTEEIKKINFDLIKFVLESKDSNEIILYKIKRNLIFNKNHKLRIGF